MGGKALQTPLIESRPFLLSGCIRVNPPWWGCVDNGINYTVSHRFYRNNGLLQMLWNHLCIRHASGVQRWLSTSSSTKTTGFSSTPHLSLTVVACLRIMWIPFEALLVLELPGTIYGIPTLFYRYIVSIFHNSAVIYSVWSLWLKGSLD